MGAKAYTTDVDDVRDQMLEQMPLEEFEKMMQEGLSRSDQMWDQSREMMDPDSEINQRMKANVMGQSQDMIATQQRMAMANAARSGMGGSGIVAQQQAAIGLQGQQQGLNAVQGMLGQQQQGAMQAGQLSAGLMGQAAQATTGMAGAIGGANQMAVNTMLQNTANQQSAANTNTMMAGQIIGGMFAGASDKRVKKDITKLGTNSQGYNIYQFKYKSDTGLNLDTSNYHIGVMADEIHPSLVSTHKGYSIVDYSGIDMRGWI